MVSTAPKRAEKTADREPTIRLTVAQACVRFLGIGSGTFDVYLSAGFETDEELLQFRHDYERQRRSRHRSMRWPVRGSASAAHASRSAPAS